MRDKETAVMALTIVAAKAKKLAIALEKGRLWEGEYGSEIAEIQRELDDASRNWSN